MKKIVALLIVVVLVVAAWSGGWLWGAGRIKDEIASLAARDGETAAKLTCGTTNVTGFPFRFDIECANATILDQDVTVTVAGIRATFLAYNPTQVVFSTLGPVTIFDAFSGASYRIDYTANSGGASLTTDDIWRGLTGEGWRIGRISLAADNLKWVDTVLGENPVLSTAHAEIQIVDMPEQHDAATGTAGLAGYAVLHEATAPAYGIADGELSLEAELTKLPDDVRDYADASILKFWQDQQGELKLVSFKGTAGEDFVESSGAVKLAAGSHIDGSVSVKSKGLIERLGTSVPEDIKGLILGQPAADGSYSQTLNIKAGIVFVGLVPVAMIPPLTAN